MSAFDAPKEVDDERNLGQTQTDGGPENVSMKTHDAVTQTTDCAGDFGLGVIGASIRHAPQHTSHALGEHWLENQVHENQGAPEMHLAPKFIHHSAGDLWEPKIDSREQGENRARSNDVMEVRDDVIRVVQVEVAVIETTTQTEWEC